MDQVHGVNGDSKITVGVVLVLAVAQTEGAEVAGKELQVFIFVGQLNMVGYAIYSTIPAMLTAEGPEVKELAKMIFSDCARRRRGYD